VLSDERRPAYAFKTVSGFEHTYIWAATGIGEAEPASVEQELPKSALPAPGGSLVQIVTFPRVAERAKHSAAPSAIAEEYRARLPGLADTFEHDGSQMHVTQTLDYAIVLDGELWLELDDGETVHLEAGDIVVQQATRHGWRNKGDRPATIAFVMLGACDNHRSSSHAKRKVAPMSRGVRIHVDAHHCLEAGERIGKIVVTV
jgi:Cupin domain